MAENGTDDVNAHQKLYRSDPNIGVSDDAAQDRDLRVLAEIEHVEPAARTVVIAPNHEAAQSSHPIDHFIGTGAVTDHIAQVPDHVMGWRRSQNGLKSFEVAMDIGEDERAHGD